MWHSCSVIVSHLVKVVFLISGVGREHGNISDIQEGNISDIQEELRLHMWLNKLSARPAVPGLQISAKPPQIGAAAEHWRQQLDNLTRCNSNMLRAKLARIVTAPT